MNEEEDPFVWTNSSSSSLTNFFVCKDVKVICLKEDAKSIQNRVDLAPESWLLTYSTFKA